MTRSCATCQWWDRQPGHDAARGYCRGGPPTASPVDGGALWAFTSKFDFCGSFRIAEALAGGGDKRTPQLEEVTS